MILFLMFYKTSKTRRPEMSARGLALDDLINPMCIFWYKAYKIGYVAVGRRLHIKYGWVRDYGGMAGLPVFLTALFLSEIGRVHV